MSKKDEIIFLMQKHHTDDNYETVATEIEKLFEVEGKVEYELEHFEQADIKWADCETVNG